jgi:Uma2 family endonuclease
MSTHAKNLLTEEQYLEIERKAEFKSEYFRGEMFAMSDASLTHTRLVRRLTVSLDAQLRSGRCEVLALDMRVLVSKSRLYTYPDVVAFCGEPVLLDGHQDTLLNPSLIVEVLSPSTEIYDRTKKFEYYQSIDSLHEYLLVSSDRVHLDLFTRQTDGRWLLTSVGALEDTLELTSVGCRLALAELYQKIDFGA